jgi:hypothetical protein
MIGWESCNNNGYVIHFTYANIRPSFRDSFCPGTKKTSVPRKVELSPCYLANTRARTRVGSDPALPQRPPPSAPAPEVHGLCL